MNYSPLAKFFRLLLGIAAMITTPGLFWAAILNPQVDKLLIGVAGTLWMFILCLFVTESLYME